MPKTFKIHYPHPGESARYWAQLRAIQRRTRALLATPVYPHGHFEPPPKHRP